MMMMTTMVAELGMSMFPVPGTGAVRCSQITADGAREEAEGLVVVPSDGCALLVRQRESKTVKDFHGPAVVATAVAPRGLAEIV